MMREPEYPAATAEFLRPQLDYPVVVGEGGVTGYDLAIVRFDQGSDDAVWVPFPGPKVGTQVEGHYRAYARVVTPQESRCIDLGGFWIV